MRLAAVVAALLVAGTVHAREYAPRVVSPHNADGYSLKTFARYPRWRGLKGDALAWEVYRYLCDQRTGLFHMNEVLEGNDVLNEYQTVRDPIKILNVYGYAYCAILGPVMAGFSEGIGLGPARTLTLPAWSHVAAEAFYNGGWHYLDCDVRAVFRRPDGSLASMADAQRDDSLWQGPQGPLFFPKDNLEKTRQVYASTPVHYYYGFHFSGHTMDYVLRRGETFTRWWRPQGGRWHHSKVFHETPWLKALLEQEPRGPKPNHRDFTIHSHGNGRFDYRPDLTNRSRDFADGVYDWHNVTPGPHGLTLQRPGEGWAIFEVRSPYIIVPRVGVMETTADDCEASVVRIEGTGVSLVLSLDNGLTWQPVTAVGGTVDLTPWVSGRYGYLLKLVLRGRPQRALVRSLAITTWVQVAPAALPSLRRGRNRMEYRTGDHYGLDTRVVEIRTNSSNPGEFLKYLLRPPKDYDPARATARVRGEVIARVQAPPHTRIAWFSAGAHFTTHQGADAARTRNTIAYATEAPRGFHEIYRSVIPTDCNHWNTNADREVRLPRPARTLYIRYVGDPAVNNLRIYAHCVEDHALPHAPVTITHGWHENWRARTQRVTLRGPGAYEVVCEGEPVDDFVQISVPGGTRD